MDKHYCKAARDCGCTLWNQGKVNPVCAEIRCMDYVLPEPITNAGRIRAMSDDKLAKKCLHLMGAERITTNPAGGGYHVFFGPTGRVMPYGEALNAWMDWLRQPAEEK